MFDCLATDSSGNCIETETVLEIPNVVSTNNKLWHRDLDPGPTANLTNGVELTFR